MKPWFAPNVILEVTPNIATEHLLIPLQQLTDANDL
jgi:hypothetical protein